MEENTSKPKATADSPVEHRRKETFSSLYSNNVHVESSGWDIKLNFGELDQKLGPNVVVQHTGITLSWPQAKLLNYFLQLHIAHHEAENGDISVPKGVIQAFPEQTPESLAALGVSQKSYDDSRKIYLEFAEKNPSAVKKRT